MERWTMRRLNETDDFSFAIEMLNERANKRNPFAPLSVKIRQAVKTLDRARDERTAQNGGNANENR